MQTKQKPLEDIPTKELLRMFNNWCRDEDSLYIKGYWFEDVYWALLDRGVNPKKIGL